MLISNLGTELCPGASWVKEPRATQRALMCHVRDPCCRSGDQDMPGYAVYILRSLHADQHAYSKDLASDTPGDVTRGSLTPPFHTTQFVL